MPWTYVTLDLFETDTRHQCHYVALCASGMYLLPVERNQSFHMYQTATRRATERRVLDALSQ